MKEYSKAILGAYLYFPTQEIEDLNSLKRKLTATSKYDSDVKIPMYSSQGDWFGVPMHTVSRNRHIAMSKELTDLRTDGMPLDLEFETQLWEGQAKVLHEFQWRWSDGGTGFVLESPPGSGKTVMAMAMMEIMDRTTLIIVPRSNLVKQWITRLIEHTNLKRADIGTVSERVSDWKGKKVVIGLVHTLARGKQGFKFRKMFGTVIFDEVDRSIPPTTFAPVLGMFPAKWRIGMSARLKRSDGLDVIFRNHLGEIYLLNRSEEKRMKPKIIVVDFPYDSGYVHKPSPKLNRRGMLITKVAKNVTRNMLIAKYAKKLRDSGRRVIVMSDRTAQLKILKDMLVKRFDVSKEDIGYYCRELSLGKKKNKIISEAERRHAASACNIILACVSEDTDCLTLEGWKTKDELREGELIASYDLVDKKIKYLPLGKVVQYPFKGQLCKIKTKFLDILMTWDHRNVVTRKDENIGIRRAYELAAGDKILVRAPFEYLENEGFDSYEMAELFGWVLAEGSYFQNAVRLCQKEGPKAQRIQELLMKTKLSHTVWSEGSTKRWQLKVDSSSIFFKIAPDKQLNAWLVGLPKKQLQALFNALIAGDGHIRDDGRIQFIQNQGKTLDWFPVVAMRLGYSAITSSKTDKCSAVFLSKREAAGFVSAAKIRKDAEEYKGTVWCPVVGKTGTWVARRNGKVFITGNTYGMFGIGTDIKSLAGLVYATPQSEVVQTKGRIERYLEGKKQPIVVDLVDTHYNDSKNWGRKRMEHYQKKNLEVNLLKV